MRTWLPLTLSQTNSMANGTIRSSREKRKRVSRDSAEVVQVILRRPLNPHGPLARCPRFFLARHPTRGKTRYRPAPLRLLPDWTFTVGFCRKVSSAHVESPSAKLCLARIGNNADEDDGAHHSENPMSLEYQAN